MKITKVDYDINNDLMSMTVNIQETSDGSKVDLDAELFNGIQNETYVRSIQLIFHQFFR